MLSLVPAQWMYSTVKTIKNELIRTGICIFLKVTRSREGETFSDALSTIDYFRTDPTSGAQISGQTEHEEEEDEGSGESEAGGKRKRDEDDHMKSKKKKTKNKKVAAKGSLSEKCFVFLVFSL